MATRMCWLIGDGVGCVVGLALVLGLSVPLRAAGSPAPTTQSTVELLWPQGAPGAKGTEDADKPTLAVYLPSGGKDSPRSAVLVCPGGGYGNLAMDHEGKQIAEWFNARGAVAMVLKYRLGPRYQHPAPLTDAQRSLRMIRARAAEWNVDANRIGVMGFSAGGHLASTLGTHFDDGNSAAKAPVERASCRPDFMILMYPVITMTKPHGHGGSRNNLLGKEPDEELVKNLSNETQVTPRTPPTFLVHTADDPVRPENSLMFFEALLKAKVPAEMHIYEKGGHGYGLAKGKGGISDWPARCQAWLESRGILKPMKDDK